MRFPANTIYSQQAIRECERLAITEFHISELTLMQRAGQAAFNVLRQHWPQARNIIVLCGTGNNGGDGYVLAALAKAAGMQVTVYYLGSQSQLTEVSQQALISAQNEDVTIEPWHQELVLQADVIVDAILGIGLKGVVRDQVVPVIGAINDAPAPIFALDIPSGLEADRGQALGCCVQADLTLTFIGLKMGLLTAAGRQWCGKVLLDQLALPTELFSKVSLLAEGLNWDNCYPLLPPRARHAHKGDNGHVLVIGGDYGMAGAVCLSAQAALRCGAGLVTVATRGEHSSPIISRQPEIMVRDVTNGQQLSALIKRATVIVIGPGLGQSDWSKALFAAAMASQLPMVVDADALTILAHNPRRQQHWVLTPHPGEAARLLDTTTAAIEADRVSAITQLQVKYGGNIVLKGAGTLLKNATSLKLCLGGNPGMASAGMGDVLSGIVGSLLAQQLSLDMSTRIGVCLHAATADKLAVDGERGLIASDIIANLRPMLN